MKARLLHLLTHRRDLALSLLVLFLLLIMAILSSPMTRQPYTYELLGFSMDVGRWPIFLTLENLTDMLRANAPVAIMALGMTLIILTAGIDLSVGSILVLSSIVTAEFLVNKEQSMPVAIAMGLGAGLLVGLLNGGLIALLKVQPFIVTLATMLGIRGLARDISKNESIGITGSGESSAGQFADLFSSKLMMIGGWAMLAVVFALLLWGTVLGRYVRAIGDNSKAADYAGLPTRRVLITVYGLMGLLAGVAGVLTCARSYGATPDQGLAMELNVIAVVVIGGTSLMGGRGSIIGTVLGALIIGILTNILGLNNIDSNKQAYIMAGVLIAAVAIQSINTGVPQWLRRSTSKETKPTA